MVFSLPVIQSCSVKQPAAVLNHRSAQVKSLFKKEVLYTFKTLITAYDQEISGLLWIKRTGQSAFRVVIGSENGFQLAAMEFQNGKMVSHKVFKKLDHKIVLKTMEEGMQLIFHENICAPVYLSDTLFTNHSCGNKQFNFFEDDLKRIVKVESFQNDKLIVTADFQHFNNEFPEKIAIRFNDIRLNWELELINP